ncbi:MAG: class I SAM-dependent methyltransferase [Candidatus Scalindua sp.]
MMENFSEKQKCQDAGYYFPYHYLDLKVDEYKLFLHTEYLNYLDLVKKLIRPFEGQLVLDAGCGDGRFCYELQHENVRIIGIDYSERAIAFARAFYPDGEFYVQDLKKISLSYRFDYIVLIETLEHFTPEDIPIILEKLFHILKPEGKLIITVPSTKIPLIFVPKHYQHFTEESLQNTLQDYFIISKCFGALKTIGIHWKIFARVREISKLFFQFKDKHKFINKWYEYLNRYCKIHFAVGKPEECPRIIAICEKVKNLAVQDSKP